MGCCNCNFCIMVSAKNGFLMASVPPSVTVESEDSISSYEYSFALEYNGPPLSYSIPEVPAFKIDHKHKISSPDSSLSPNLNSHASVNDVDDVLKSTSSLESPGVEDDRNIRELHSGMTLVPTNSEICSFREDEPTQRTKHANCPSAVTFRDPESNYMIDTNSEKYFSSIPVKPHAVRPEMKGSCYRCLKGDRLTVKEVCIVCSAEYCPDCVISVLGSISMPQGGKCVTCIGFGIDENRRGNCSWLLKQLLSECVVSQIMLDERSCEANQIPPEHFIVNLQPLDKEQLMLLLNCSNPPKQLKPGSYWYDKASGLWGKEGQPPCEIITPMLDVGGRLQQNASNGNTKVAINGCVITKKELVMLKMAGVQCEGIPNFWVNADGSYREEGQKNDRGRIWDKRMAKFDCAIFALPVPSTVTLSDEGDTANIKSLQKKTLHKFLLVGSVNSGAGTIFRQAKILYKSPFSENELQNIKLVIQCNLFTYLGILLEGCKKFEEKSLLENKEGLAHNESSLSGNTGDNVGTTLYSVGPRLKGFSDWLLKCMVSGNLEAVFPAAIREYGPLVEGLWRDEAIQATYNRRNELTMLPRSANYFLDRAVEISKVDYEPSDMDILYAEGLSLSNSLTSMEFSFPKSSSEDSLYPEYQHESSLRLFLKSNQNPSNLSFILSRKF